MNKSQKLKLLSQQNGFLEWLRLKTTLKKLRYADNHSEDDKVKLAYKNAVMDYERDIMYNVGTKLWHNHRTAFREHKKYYYNQLRKPFSMTVANFSNFMREYRALLRHLPPLSSKIVTKSFDAKWGAMEITNEEIRAAIYNALPEDYKTHITYQCKADWQNMDENEFLNAMLAYKFFNNTQRSKLLSQQNKFLEWLRLKTTLKKLRYTDNHSSQISLQKCSNGL